MESLFATIDAAYMSKLLVILLQGVLTSLRIFAITLVIAVPLGFLVSFAKKSKYKIVSVPINIYILIMRGTPLLLQILIVYFGPYYVFRLSYDRFAAIIIAFVLNYAAYFAEIFRGGIESMPVGQYEAAGALGFTKAQTFFRIILPQVVKRILPASANEVITLVKDTALAQTIGVAELFALSSKQASFKTSVIPLFVAGIFYFVLNWIVTAAFAYFEKKLDYYK